MSWLKHSRVNTHIITSSLSSLSKSSLSESFLSDSSPELCKKLFFDCFFLAGDTFFLDFSDQKTNCPFCENEINFCKAPVIFGKWKCCRACNVCRLGRSYRFFGIEVLQIYRQKPVTFRKPQKNNESLHPTVQCTAPVPNCMYCTEQSCTIMQLFNLFLQF